jgi:hypothetical protein
MTHYRSLYEELVQVQTSGEKKEAVDGRIDQKKN